MLRGLLAHKLRLVLSSLAVVLGTMFMAGAFIGGDTVAQGFQELFTTINTSVDVQVTAKDTAPGAARSGRPAAFVDEQALARIRGVPGADQVTPQVIADGARVVGKDGKVIGSSLVGQSFTSERYFHPRPSATRGPDPADPSKSVDAP